VKAVVHERYGPPEVLRIVEIERPSPGPKQVLVRVHASTVTRGDTELRTLAHPFTRPMTGMRRPKRPVPGTEFAGRVEATGADASRFAVGAEVFGIGSGANAEFLTVDEDGVIAPKPARLSFEEAAAIPDGSLLALSILRALPAVRGKRVLVYGAAGSIGTATVQLAARHLGADVTAVCDGRDVELVGALGANRVIDRDREDFAAGAERYDVVFDAVGKHSFWRSRRVLAPGGTYVTTGLGSLYHVPLAQLLTRFVGSKRAMLGVGRYRPEDLLEIAGLVDAGTYRPVIDRTYPLEDAVEANRYVETGRKTGNVVLRVSDG
jgi:NADPH:quinone reductase-like Zn-dependent oxidoreductase